MRVKEAMVVSSEARCTFICAKRILVTEKDAVHFGEEPANSPHDDGVSIVRKNERDTEKRRETYETTYEWSSASVFRLIKRNLSYRQSGVVVFTVHR